MALDLQHQTKAQFAARFWDLLLRLRRTAADSDAGATARERARQRHDRMIWWLYNRVQAGDFTANEVRLSFNAAYGRSLTAGQWTTFVSTTLAPIRDRYQAMLDQGDL